MRINIQIDDTIVEAATSANMSAEEWIQEAIKEKLRIQSTSVEPEERKVELLAKLFKTFKSPSGKVVFDGDDSVVLKDLEARGLVDSRNEGFVRSSAGYYYMSGFPTSPITPGGIKYLERTRIERFVDRPVYKLLKEMRSWL